MIEIFKELLTPNMRVEDKLNRVRELLQIIALKILYDKNSLDRLAFVGGTALRILFDLRRFSEDLDFSLREKEGYDFPKMMGELEAGFNLYGLKADIKVKDSKTVHCAHLKFSKILKELGLSPLADQKMTIKLDVDTNPPKGAEVKKTMVNKTYMFYVVHHDLSSLFAGKLHACFYRKFVKGRDFYDFIWYLGKKIKPNYGLLNNAIEQTQGSLPKLDEHTIKDFLIQNIERIDLEQAARDVERFLEDKNELKLFDKDLLKNSIEQLFGG